jgi:hypothetical protein
MALGKKRTTTGINTRNVSLLMELISRVADRPDRNLPGMGVFSGPPGYGKSKAVASCASPNEVYFVELRFLWTRKDVLEKILEQMNIAPETKMSRMLDQIGEQLSLTHRVLIIDEADLLVRKNMLEIVRDIYECSQGTVILVGEQTLPAALEREGRIHSRMLDWVDAVPTGMADARLFANHHCKNVTVSDDLLDRVIDAASGAARYVCASLMHIAEFADLHNMDALDASTYTGKLSTGKLPERRRSR